MLLKSDNGPAMLQVLVEARKRQEEKLEIVVDENSIPYDSQSNGGAEIGCKLLRGQGCAMRGCFEHRIQRRIPPRHPLLAWMVEHAAALRTHLVKGKGGNTAYQRLQGRPLIGKLMTFGECGRYKLRSKDVDDPADHRVCYNLGFVLGMDGQKTGQYKHYDPVDGSLRFARTAVRLPDEEKWNVGQLQEVKILPWQAHET